MSFMKSLRYAMCYLLYFHSHDWVKEQLEKPLAEGKTFMFIKDASFGIDGYYDKLPKVISDYYKVFFS